MKRAVSLLLAMSTVTTAWAQGLPASPKIVGKLRDVQGFVKVFAGDQSVNAFSGAALVVGTRVLTTASGSATLDYDNGCDIKLKANESIVVKDDSNCAALAGAVQAVPVAAIAAVPMATVAAGAALAPAVMAGGALAIGAVLAIQNKNKTSGS